jgi:hypothetical protein
MNDYSGLFIAFLGPMRVTQLLAIVTSLRFQMRLARAEAMLSEQNKVLQDTKLGRQAQQRSNDHDEEGKEQTVKHENKTLQISTDLDPCSFAVSRQIHEELQATIAESKDAVERSRSLIENSNKLLEKKQSA